MHPPAESQAFRHGPHAHHAFRLQSGGGARGGGDSRPPPRAAAAGRDAGDARGAWALGWNGASVLAFDMHHGGPDGGLFRHSDERIGHTQRPNIRHPDVNVDMLYACPDPAAAGRAGMPCGVWQLFGPLRYLSSAPRSRHRGGVQSLWADGRVTFLEDGIDEILMTYLIAIGDGQPVTLAGR